MLWQDWVLSAGSLLFTLAIIPTIRSKEKPALAASLLTGGILTVFAFVYITLELWFTVFSTSLTALSWYILAYQKFSQEKLKRA